MPVEIGSTENPNPAIRLIPMNSLTRYFSLPTVLMLELNCIVLRLPGSAMSFDVSGCDSVINANVIMCFPEGNDNVLM